MDYSELLKLVDKLWDSTPPKKRREVFKALRPAIPEDLKKLYDSVVDNKRSSILDSPDQKVLILIHGIQTDGSWQEKLHHQLKDIPQIRFEKFGFNVVTAAQLVGPFRSTPIERIVREIRTIKSQEKLAKIYVIAHSFGTYVTSKIIDKHPDIEFEKIILCGSIISRDYPWHKNARTMPKNSIVNDIGTRDIWPVIATFTTFGYGSSGRRGFQSASVTDRYFDYGHSDFFEDCNDHIAKYWRPIIETADVVHSEWGAKMPKTGLGVLLLSHPWIARPLFYIAVTSLLIWTVIKICKAFF